jgi:signal transduction histidine kinase
VTAGDAGGSGLGLFMCRRLVAEQGGDLRVLPAGEAGFGVRFDLPASRVPGSSTPTPAGLPTRNGRDGP